MGKWTGRFILPQLDKPTYRSLQFAMAELGASQWEVVSLGVKVITQSLQSGQKAQLLELLEHFRTTAPSDEPQQDPAKP